jgi:hypothetical protein
MSLFVVAALLVAAIPSVAGAQTPPPDTTIPAPSPVVIQLGRTPVFELLDGGGGLPYLGSATSYNAGDWEPALRNFHDSGVYDTELAQIDKIAKAAVLRTVHKSDFRSHKGRFHKGHGRVRAVHFKRKKLALVLDIDETSLSTYTAINADNFTFGPQSQAEATNEIPHRRQRRRPVLRPGRRSRGRRVQARQPVLLPAIDSPRGQRRVPARHPRRA